MLQIGVLEQLLRRPRRPRSVAIRVQFRRAPPPDPARRRPVRRCRSSGPTLRDVQVNVVDGEPGTLARARLECLLEPAEVVRRERHAERGHDAGDARAAP